MLDLRDLKVKIVKKLLSGDIEELKDVGLFELRDIVNTLIIEEITTEEEEQEVDTLGSEVLNALAFIIR